MLPHIQLDTATAQGLQAVWNQVSYSDPVTSLWIGRGVPGIMVLSSSRFFYFPSYYHSIIFLYLCL